MTSIIVLLLGLLTLAAAIVLIVWLATDGRPEPNRWGQNPKASLVQ